MHIGASRGVKNFVPYIDGDLNGDESLLVSAPPVSRRILNPKLFGGRRVVAKDECDFQRALASVGLPRSLSSSSLSLKPLSSRASKTFDLPRASGNLHPITACCDEFGHAVDELIAKLTEIMGELRDMGCDYGGEVSTFMEKTTIPLLILNKQNLHTSDRISSGQDLHTTDRVEAINSMANFLETMKTELPHLIFFVNGEFPSIERELQVSISQIYSRLQDIIANAYRIFDAQNGKS
ncbi:MAG: hypothetical protein LBF94_00410 [Puniceicoccales bacterium]|jgi:hypothetical protein|nr:hypothetical protein [Puniceicoccales bacterium]